MLKKSLMALLTASSLMSGAAWADEPESRLRPFVGGGVTFGGDRNRAEGVSFSPGGLLDMRIGLEYRPWNSSFSVQGSVGYHVGRVDHLPGDGDLYFTRVPFELLGHWHATDSWAFGGGLRKASNVRGSGTGDYAIDGKATFDSSMGFVLETEYAVTASLGIKGRFVYEKYRVTDDPAAPPDFRLQGRHFGLIAVYYFD